MVDEADQIDSHTIFAQLVKQCHVMRAEMAAEADHIDSDATLEYKRK